MTDHEDRLSTLEMKVQSVEADLNQLKKDVSANHDLIQIIKSNTDEIVEVFRTSKGFIRVLNGFGVILKWFIVTGAAFGALWAYLHGHSIK